MTRLRIPLSLWAVLVAAVVIELHSPAPAQAQMLDQNGNGMSDIWEIIYGATNLPPDGDADGDGMSNYAESIAGTDPFDPNSVARITGVSSSVTNFTVSMPCALGKQYQLMSLTGLGSGSNWITETSLVVRAGSVVNLTAPTANAPKFFRIAISDVDPMGHGLNDWEEYKLGLDPTKPSSNGQLDGNGQPMTDYAYATNRLASQNVVTLSATDPAANQPDAGQSAVNLGVLTVYRGGFPLNSITVNLGLPPASPALGVEGLDFAALPRSVTLPVGANSATIAVTPLANTNRLAPVLATMQVLPGPGYSIGMNNNASVLIYPTATPSGTGLTGFYYTNSSSTYSSNANFNAANSNFSRMDSTVDFVWGTTNSPFGNGQYYTIRWLGQVQPQYSELYYFDVNCSQGAKLWVNDQLIIDNWATHGIGDLVGTIPLHGGVRYNIRLEYFNSNVGSSAATHLSWYSPSQSKQIIPSNRLYPTSATPAPATVTSPVTAIAFLGQPFTFTNTAANSNSVSSFTASGLPPGLGINSTNGVINGVPGVAGDFQVSITASNTFGVGASALDLKVIDTGSSIVQEIWNGVPGSYVTDIPVNTPPSSTNVVGLLTGNPNYGVDYGERIRGYFTAPVTGNYYFWISGGDSAELWLSNDGLPANKVRRAYVSAPGTGTNQWNVQATQQSPWLTLTAGQNYYLEILHKAGSTPGGNWSVGWLLDPFGTNTVPSALVPGYLLGRYYQPPQSFLPGTLYSANMLAQPGVASFGMGSATLRLSADGSQAVLNFKVNGLTAPITGEHIHCDQYLNNPSQIIFDIDAATPRPDGSYVWNIGPVGTFTNAAQIVELIQEGKSYINIHTVNYPSGEINGHFIAVDGSPTFAPPPAPPTWTDDHGNSNAAARFLIQSTFGPSPNDIASVQSLGYAGWISNQFSLPATHHLPVVLANASPDVTDPYPSSLTFNTWWQQSVTAPDQLRQRVAFALSEIMVISQNGVLLNNATAMSDYYDVLLDDAFGNYRTLLEDVTLSPAMGLYLNMLGNDVGNIVTGVHANENYAREIQQLFSIGLNRMWPDGTLVTDSQGNLVPTYNQNVIMGFASTFTGWTYYQPNQTNGRLPTIFNPPANYTNPMVLVPLHHELGTQLLLDNIMLPAAQGSQLYSTNASFDAYCSSNLESALDVIFNNQNVGPFICRELIQRLVTSNPSRDYLYRVVQAFNDNGSGVRGDLKAVISAILLDYEARSPALITQPTFGKQREPLLRVTAPARAFPAPPSLSGTYSQSGDQTNLITTSVPHRLTTGDSANMSFVDGSGGQPALPTQNYTVTVRSPTTFTVIAAGLGTGSYGQTNGTISVNINGHGMSAGFSTYLVFTTGASTNGAYSIATVPDGNHFTVTTTDPTTNSGKCLIPMLTGGGYTVTSRTNLTVDAALPHGLNVGDNVFIRFTQAGSPTNGQYQVAVVPDATHFICFTPTNSNQTQTGDTVYPLVPPPLTRSGTANILWNSWNLNTTDTTLYQTPLNSPTVFNFFYPDYEFPGSLAAAGLTTPEFQLTSDTTVAGQMNFLEGGILNNTGNTNGLSSFAGGGGALYLDIGPWMTPTYTAGTGVPSLVDGLNSLLLAGQLSPSAKSTIVNYVTNTVNFPYSNSPTAGQMRDRVRAVVHLLLTSPDYTIQK